MHSRLVARLASIEDLVDGLIDASAAARLREFAPWVSDLGWIQALWVEMGVWEPRETVLLAYDDGGTTPADPKIADMMEAERARVREMWRRGNHGAAVQTSVASLRHGIGLRLPRPSIRPRTTTRATRSRRHVTRNRARAPARPRRSADDGDPSHDLAPAVAAW